MKNTIGVMLAELLAGREVKIQRWGHSGYEVIVADAKAHTHHEDTTLTGAIGKAHAKWCKR